MDLVRFLGADVSTKDESGSPLLRRTPYNDNNTDVVGFLAEPGCQHVSQGRRWVAWAEGSCGFHAVLVAHDADVTAKDNDGVDSCCI